MRERFSSKSFRNSEQLLKKFNYEWDHYLKHFIFYKRRNLYSALIHHLEAAQERIWLTTPYFSPNKKLIQALCSRAAAGVDVQLLFPMDSDVWAVKYAMESYYKVLLSAGVKIFEYVPAILHSKVSVIDYWVTVGSSNLDYQSLFYNIEADVVVGKPENISLIERQFLTDLSQSQQIMLDSWSRRPFLNRLREAFFRCFTIFL